MLFQTAIVPIQSSDGNNIINARVLLDSASKRTITTNKLAQKLKLPSEHKKHLAVSTFGAIKTTDIDTYVVNFKDGSYILLSTNVLKQITESIQRNPLLQKDQEFLNLIPQSQLADHIPNTLESAGIDILIGSDFSGTLLVVTRLFCLQAHLCYHQNLDTL